MSLNGVIVLDKPEGWTSHDVVAKMRHILGERSIGHLGTLDPMATGVLPLVIGKMTRLCQFYEASEKAYEGIIRFGFATDTYDADGEPLGPPQAVKVTLEDTRSAAAGFVGKLQQVPPPFSAKKIKGVPAYKLARKKLDVDLKPVEVEVKEFIVLGLQGDLAEFRSRVSSGTYLRSLAHEMGQKLGCRGTLGEPSANACGGVRSGGFTYSRPGGSGRRPRATRRTVGSSAAGAASHSMRDRRRGHRRQDSPRPVH